MIDLECGACSGTGLTRDGKLIVGGLLIGVGVAILLPILLELLFPIEEFEPPKAFDPPPEAPPVIRRATIESNGAAVAVVHFPKGRAPFVQEPDCA